MTLRLGGDGAITGCTSLENPDLTVSGLTISGSFDAEKVLVASGTAAAPSYTFSGDTDNGLYYAGTNSVGVSTAGTSAIVVDASQNVGIGTTSPNSLLDCAGGNITLTEDTNLIFKNSARDTNRGAIQFTSGAEFRIRYGALLTEALRIDSSGNVGVGASTVDEKLHVEGSSGQSTTIKVECTATSSERSAIEFFNGSISRGRVSGSNDFDGLTLDSSTTESAAVIRFRTGGASLSEAMRINSAGNVGIGTTTPGGRIGLPIGETSLICQTATTPHIASNAGSIALTISDGGNHAGVYVNNTHDGTYSSQDITFLTAQGGISLATERMRIDNTGNVIIKDSTGADNITLKHDGSNGSIINNGGEFLLYAEGSQNMIFHTNSSERMRVDSSGRLLVGTSSAHNGTPLGAAINLESSTSFGPQYRARGTSSDQYPVYYITERARGSSIVQSGDELASFQFTGYDGSAYLPAAYIQAFVDDTPGTNDMPGRLVFSTTVNGGAAPTERMRITNGGATKMSTDGTYLVSAHVHEMRQDDNNWTVYVTNKPATSPYGISIRHTAAAPNNTSSHFLQTEDTGGTKAEIRSNGGIANYQANNVNLCDEREKKNIETLDSTWGCLKNWELKKFHYNEDADTDDKRYGVIAQQVEQHCPEVLTEWVKQKAEEAELDDDGNVVTPAKEEILRKGVKEQQMMWMAIKALQEAQDRIETLEAEVAELKNN